jgi:hypothetical protein
MSEIYKCMGIRKPSILLIFIIPLIGVGFTFAQNSVNDTIRLGAVNENGSNYPMIFLPEYIKIAELMDPDERKRRDRLRNDIFVVYPYALTAATILKGVNENLDKLDTRRERKKYLKSIDKTLDNTFKQPLKNLSIDQGHVLIKLIDRQTGQNCYSIIKELKGGFSAVVWQSVGVFFNNNLSRDYDPDDRDKEIETIVRDMEASSAYRYQLYQQEALLKKVKNQ